jgi:hypothetical protein
MGLLGLSSLIRERLLSAKSQTPFSLIFKLALLWVCGYIKIHRLALYPYLLFGPLCPKSTISGANPYTIPYT